jgi:hypothetical protein
MEPREPKEQLWDRLSNESGRAYEAFKIFMYMSPAERSVVGAWREWTENPEAARPSPFFEGWGREHAWSERARAHDAHIERIRRGGMEKAIEEEAEFQARQVEQMRFRYNELISNAYLAAMEWFEDTEWAKSNLRSSDVVNIIRLHLEATDKLSADAAMQVAAEGDWDESKLEKSEVEEAGEMDEESRRILAEVEALRKKRLAEGNDPGPEEDLL